MPDVDNNVYETVNPWLAVLMYADWYQDIIREKWTAAYDAEIFDRAAQAILADKDTYLEAFKRNEERWGRSVTDQSVAMELCAKAKKCYTEAQAAEYLHEWFVSRVEFMNGQWHK